MKRDLIVLTDYKNKFESRHKPQIYRFGLEKELLEKSFKHHGINVTFYSFSKFYNENIFNLSVPILYTSTEDRGLKYNSFIVDVIFDLSERGCKIIPNLRYLRATNNKVSMELLRKSTHNTSLNSLSSKVFGTLEEFLEAKNRIEYPCVIKGAYGALSTNVKLATTKNEAIRAIKDINGKPGLGELIKEYGRKVKYKKYVRDSFYREKFIVQDFIAGLKNDWKVYFFGEKLYIWYRETRDDDFRASGSGKFKFNENVPLPNGLLDYALACYKSFDVPFASMDIGFDGQQFYMFEIQFIHFGKNGHYNSTHYYENVDNKWIVKENTDSIEKVYVDAVAGFIKNDYRNIYKII